MQIPSDIKNYDKVMDTIKELNKLKFKWVLERDKLEAWIAKKSKELEFDFSQFI